MNTQLPVDPGTFDAGENAEVGGEPRRICQRQRGTPKLVRRGQGQDLVLVWLLLNMEF